MFEPRCSTCVPSTLRSAACSRWVALCSAAGRLGAVGEAALEFLFGAGAAHLLMFGEGGVITGPVDLESFFLRHFNGQFDREPVGLIQIESVFAGDDFLLDMGGNAVDQFLELMGPLFERDRELLFLAVELFADDGGPVPEFGVDIAELFDDRIRDFRGEGVVDAELAPFADRPADQAARTYG